MTDAATAFQGHGSRGYRAYVLAVLLAVYTFNFIDRIIIGIVQEPIRREFLLDDGVMGWLGGPTFAIFYTLLGVPIARAAERQSRVNIVAIGAALWSVMTAACGMAANFLHLVLARIGVGIGEAACVPPSHSMISDYFPAHRRASALAIFALGVPVGTMLAAVGGGWLVQNSDWRTAFLALGIPGLAAALLLKLTVREPPRWGGQTRAPGLVEALKALRGKASFWHVAVAAALVSTVGYGTAQFLKTHFERTYLLEAFDASLAFGVVAGLGAGLGTFFGGALSDKLQARHPRVLTWLPALGLALALPLYIVALLQANVAISVALFTAAAVFHYLYLAPTFTVAQSVVSPLVRATGAAILILIINLIGYGIGPPLLGEAANYFTAQQLAPVGLSLADCRGVEDGVCAAARAGGLKTALLCVVCILAWPIAHFLLAGRSLLEDRVS